MIKKELCPFHAVGQKHACFRLHLCPFCKPDHRLGRLVLVGLCDVAQTWRAGAPGACGVAPREGAADWLVNWSERAADALRDLIGRGVRLPRRRMMTGGGAVWAGGNVRAGVWTGQRSRRSFIAITPRILKTLLRQRLSFTTLCDPLGSAYASRGQQGAARRDVYD